jgi:endoglucanase
MIAPAAGVALAAAGLALLAGAPRAAAGPWGTFKKRFVVDGGRVADTGNKGVSHSEGQGWGMLLAVHHRDRKTFDAMWNWTQKHLAVRADRLFAWKWVPDAPVAVPDRNNASDGDLLIAWALARAGRQWKAPEYKAAAEAIAGDVLSRLVKRVGANTVLLPGEVGFDKAEGVVVNLSYWVYPALPLLAQIRPDPAWRELEASGLRLLDTARFGRWGLPPDWLVLADPPEPAADFAPRYGYDAVRIPLYLLWGRQETSRRLRPFADYWKHFRGASFIPAWTDLTNDSIDSYNASPGIRAIAAITTRYPRLRRARIGGFAEEQDYYSYALLLLSDMMLEERIRR